MTITATATETTTCQQRNRAILARWNTPEPARTYDDMDIARLLCLRSDALESLVAAGHFADCYTTTPEGDRRWRDAYPLHSRHRCIQACLAEVRLIPSVEHIDQMLSADRIPAYPEPLEA